MKIHIVAKIEDCLTGNRNNFATHGRTVAVSAKAVRSIIPFRLQTPTFQLPTPDFHLPVSLSRIRPLLRGNEAGDEVQGCAAKAAGTGKALLQFLEFFGLRLGGGQVG